MSVVFLDFDGPMFPTKMCLFKENREPISDEMIAKIGLNQELYQIWKMDDFAILALHKLYEFNPFEIVVSSNWGNGNTREVIQNLFNANNIEIPLAQDYRLAQVNMSRLERVKEYIVRNNIQNYLMIDDYDSCPEMENLDNIEKLGLDSKSIFAVNFNNGISLENYIDMRTQIIEWDKKVKNKLKL